MKANNTFRTLIFIFSLMLITTTVKSQGTTKTPMGQTVYLQNNWDTPAVKAAAEAWAAQWVIDNNSDAVRIGAATSNYNCHSYAWNVVEGKSSSNAWLNQTHNGNPNLDKYWTNDAYTSTTTVNDHEKIFYSSSDHSAVTTGTSGKVRSKWGVCGLYEHSTAQCPYNSGALQYYKLVDPTISGSAELLCNNYQGTFSELSFTNIALSYDWSTSSPLNEVSGDGTSSYTVKGTPQNGTGIVNLKITTPSGATSSVNRDVYVGPQLPGSIDIAMDAPPRRFTAFVESVPTAISYNWYLNGVMNSSHGESAVFNRVSPYCGGSYNVDVEVLNGCGLSLKTHKTVLEPSCSYSLLLSPNPSTSESTVELKNENIVSLSSVQDWELEVYDPGQLLKEKKTKIKDKKINLNTSNWKDGIYIVLVKIGDEMVSEKLIVKH